MTTPDPAAPEQTETNEAIQVVERSRPPSRAAAVAHTLGARLRPYAFALLASTTLGFVAIRKILERAGHPALPLDDSFIHLQYARRLAEGGFFSYIAGEGYTTGATSLLWPMLIAPFHLLGLHELSLIWAAWFWGTIAHAGLAVEVMRLARRFCGRQIAIGAHLMSLGFGAFAWFAWSGMETIPFTWMLVRTARASAEFVEPEPDKPPVSPYEVALLGVLTPLLRPEGFLASGIAFLALAVWAVQAKGWRSKVLALVPLTGPLFVPGLHLLLAGHATSATTMVKWLPANPAYDRASARAFFESNVRLLFNGVLDGGDWSAVFVPEGHLLFVLLGLVALAVCAWRERLSFHAFFVLLLVAATVLPTTYLSFLWNRVRYVWPFFAMHFVLLACLARMIGDGVNMFVRTNARVGSVLAGVFVGMFVVKLPWTLSDLATSAHAIDRQQVKLGLWARENLPPDARIGVNDTGAIAYLSNRKTFDVCGLTTEGESFYWVHGAGSRFEHYEKLPAEKRPSHFIVYPQWMSCDPVLGDELHRETVTDQSILGGHTMIAYEARWDKLGSGARPIVPLAPGAEIVDEIDVSDLESEKAHGFMPLGSDHENVAEIDIAPRTGVEALDERPVEVADGGRQRRQLDRFVVTAKPSRPMKLVMRVSADQDTDLVVRMGGLEVGTTQVPSGTWVERTVELPAAGDHVAEIEVESKQPTMSFNSFHYWIVQ